MRINTIFIFLTAFLSCGLLKAQDFKLLIGSSANAEKTDGVYLYTFNSQTGTANYEGKTDVNRPSYMALSADKKNLFVITEASMISSFNYDPLTGKLGFLNKQNSGGMGPIHISSDRAKAYVFAANYDGGSLSALRLDNQGRLDAPKQIIQHTGNSIDKIRQAKPFSHSVVLTPDGKYLINPDLGIDKIHIYKINRKNGADPLSLNGIVGVKAGSGPRFFTFHPNKKFAYVVQEMGGMVTAFAYKNGKLNTLQSVSMLADGFTGRSGAADIHISPDGKFLYASNRGDANELTIFTINQKTGLLNFAGRYPSAAKNPRYFAIDPSGNFLLLTNQGSDNVTILKRDQQTGLLQATGKQILLNKPVCLLFAED